MNEKFKKPAQLGAGDFEHTNGVLLDHLIATQALLKKWQASAVLQDAGLYHAAYGTVGFDEHLVSIDQRNKISNIIGKAAEEIVYLYCACDRDYFWPQFSGPSELEFETVSRSTCFNSVSLS
ncbi:MAG: hypothetical protein JKX83_01985 [Pseudomonadales bacterium]|nr:hypothetical protein [Pseudomonadales bacterium]